MNKSNLFAVQGNQFSKTGKKKIEREDGKGKKILECIGEVETTEEYDGYWYGAGEALAIVILGSLRGLRNVNRIYQRAAASLKLSAEKLPERTRLEWSVGTVRSS